MELSLKNTSRSKLETTFLGCKFLNENHNHNQNHNHKCFCVGVQVLFPNIFLHILHGQWSAGQVLIFVLNSLRDDNFPLRMVEDITIWDQRKKDSLTVWLSEQNHLVFFLL